ncbi:MAG: Protein GrpE [Anaerolineales bacterium]|nr:Protein GrpE [Anaerolineales bacterium]
MGGETKKIPVRQKNGETKEAWKAERKARPESDSASAENAEDATRPALDESVVEEFERELAEARRKADEHHDKYLRAVAELENVRKRLEKTYQSRVTQARRDLLRKILDVADNLERALGTAEGGGDIVDGVDLTYRQLQRLLSEQGVEPIEAVGQPFDPMKHEAVSAVPTNGVEDETVVAEELRGYTHQDELLRPSRVYVAKEELSAGQ